MSTLIKTSRNLWILEGGKDVRGIVKKEADFGTLLYAANPVYIDVSQGRSHMADKKQTPLFGIFVDSLIALIIFLGLLVYNGLDFRHEETGILTIFLLIFISIMILFAVSYIAVFLKSFTAPLDNIVRFDRKRQVACFWLEKRQLFGNVHSFKDFVHIVKDDRVFVEIPWRDLTLGVYKIFKITGNDYNPVLLAFNKNAKANNRDWKDLRLVEGARCFIKINNSENLPNPYEDTALARVINPLEAIRSFMEDGYKPSMRPSRWRKLHRPDWRYMFKYLWPDQETNESYGIFSKIFGFISEMFTLPAIISTNWLYWKSMQKAPIPRFPEEIEKRNADDLRQLGIDQFGEPESSSIRTKEENCKDTVNNLKRYKFIDRISSLFTGVFIIFSALCVVDFLYVIFSDDPKYSIFNLLWISPRTEQGYIIEMLIAIFILCPICNAVALAIVKLSWPLMKKYNTDTVAWIPAKPLPDTPANQMTDDGRQKTEDRYGL